MKLYQSLFALTLAAMLPHQATAQTKTATLRIDADRPEQTITGFGGFAFAATWGSNLTDASIKAMYGCDNTSKTLGYTLLRARISPDSVASWGSDNWNPTIQVMKKAREATEAAGRRHLNFATSWTPPRSVKSNNDYKHGQILESKFGEYTDYLNAFIHRIERSGTDIDYISLQNEPDWSPDYEGCIWSAQNFINYYKNYAQQLDRPLLGPEYLGYAANRVDSILNDAQACANLAVIGGHIYGSGNFDHPNARAKGKERWMTEFLDEEGMKDANGHDIPGHTFKMTDAVHFGRIVNTSMLANFNGWVHYALKASYGMIGDGTHGNTMDEITKRGYVLAQFAKYCTGTTRLHTTLSDPGYTGLSASAYLTQSADTVVVVILNPTTTKTEVTYQLPFLSKGCKRIATNQTQNLVSNNISYEETSDPVINCPPVACCTYLFVKSADLPTPRESEHQPIFADSLQNYNGNCVHPEGWKVTIKGTAYSTSSGNSYYWDGRPQLYPYSPESAIPMGIVLTTDANGKGEANYGSNSNHRLPLEVGKYRLIWHAIGYNHGQRFYCNVTKSGSTSSLAHHSGIDCDASVNSSWGSARDTEGAIADTLDFEVTVAGNYELNFRCTYQAGNAVGGVCKGLVGGITLDRLDSESGIEAIHMDVENSEERYYDLLGRPVSMPRHGNIYVDTQGRKLRF